MVRILNVLREAFQVSRPAMGVVTSFLYLYKNNNHSNNNNDNDNNNNHFHLFWMSLYFGFIFQLGCNAGNDYMDWDRDQNEIGREFSVSRGKATSKRALWWYYVFATLVAAILASQDPFHFGAQYFVITEFAGQLAYNGIFLGFAINDLSLVKTVGFPLDVIVAAWTYMPFSYLVAQQIWIPDVTIAAWGNTMLWAQLKDYHHEKYTNVRTTATVLGPTWTAVLIALAATIMVHQDPRFLPYGAYTVYKCYIYPVKGIGKMSVVMALNLVGIVCTDPNIPFTVKYPLLVCHILAYLLYKYSWALEQKYYALQSIVYRKRPYDNQVWNETDPHVLLWKVGGLTGRSASGAMGLFGTELARLCLMGFIVFRVQDTWADVCLDSRDRIEGLRLLPKRLAALMKNDDNNDQDNNVEVPDKHKDDIRWDFASRVRNRMYVDIALNVHRFDRVFLGLPRAHKDILVTYANQLADGWIELEQRKDEPITPEIMRKHAEVALDAGFFGMCKGADALELVEAIDVRHTANADPKASTAYISFSDGLWYMNLASTIEEDVAEGVSLDDELRAMNGCIKGDVVKRVRIKWLIKAMDHICHSRAFLSHPDLVKSWAMRFFILMFSRTTVRVAEQYLHHYQNSQNIDHSGGKELFYTLLESWYEESYFSATEDALSRAEELARRLRAL